MSTLVRNAGATMRGILVGATLLGAVPFALTPVAASAAEQVSQAFYDKYTPAGEAVKKHEFASAVKLGKEALAASKSSYEKQTALLLVFSAAANGRDYNSAIEAGEQLSAIEGVPAKTKLDIQRALGQMYAATNRLDKALVTTKDVIKATGGTPADYDVLVRIYNAQKDCANGLPALDKLLGGKAANEDQLNFQSFCAYKGKETDKRLQVNEELLKRFPKATYFNQLSVIYQGDKKIDDSPTMLAFLRFGLEKDYLKDESEYVKLANLDLDTGAAGEAQRVLEKGIARKVFKDAAKASRLLDQAKATAADDKKQIGQLDAEAKAGKNGDADVKVGAKYYSMGEYAKAAEALQRALSADRAARIKRPDDANMLYGITLVKLKKNGEAAKAFAAAKGNATMAPAARVWANSVG